MITFLYILWFLVPLFLFILSAWNKLEQIGNKNDKGQPGFLFKQGLFTLICAFVSLLVDQHLLENLHNTIGIEWVPLGFLQIILFPIVLYIGALLLGPSKTIKITKITHVTEKRRK